MKLKKAKFEFSTPHTELIWWEDMHRNNEKVFDFTVGIMRVEQGLVQSLSVSTNLRPNEQNARKLAKKFFSK